MPNSILIALDSSLDFTQSIEAQKWSFYFLLLQWISKNKKMQKVQ